MGRIGFPTQSGAVTPSLLKYIATQVLGAPAATISFSGIDTKYRIFVLLGLLVKDSTVASCRATINGDNANYDYQRILANGASLGAGRTTSTNTISDSISNIAANGTAKLDLVIAKSTSSVRAQAIGTWNVDRDGEGIAMTLTGGQWNNTADAMNRVDIVSGSGNLAANSAFGIYGIEI